MCGVFDNLIVVFTFAVLHDFIIDVHLIRLARKRVYLLCERHQKYNSSVRFLDYA